MDFNSDLMKIIMLAVISAITKIIVAYIQRPQLPPQKRRQIDVRAGKHKVARDRTES